MSRLKISIQKLKKLNYNGKVLEDIDLSQYSTFKCGGKGKILLEICTLENFIGVMMYLQELKSDYFILGAGSNILVSDKGYDGVILKLDGDFKRIIPYNDGVVECGAGVKLSQAFAYARKHSLGGLEDSVGIPATIGGAVFMNASAYNFRMSNVVKYVVAYVDGKITYFDNSECGFGYRKSVFQHNQSVILRVGLELKTKSQKEIDVRFKEVVDKRFKSQPIEYPSAGCVFKRREDIEVSRMIDEYGLKGLTFGGAKVSEKHANFIINFNDALAQDVYELIEIVKKRFYAKSGILLETEIIFLGEFDEITG
jgi:UDP-N-acetylmuramate dehydrogenase